MSIMAAQKRKKKFFWQKVFVFLNAYYPKTELIKALNSLVLPDHLEGRLLEIPKTEALGIYFCLKIISKLAPE